MNRQLRKRPSVWWTALIAVAASLACGRPDPGASAASDAPRRWIDEASDRRFDPAAIRRAAEVFSWVFETPEDLRPWTPPDGVRPRIVDARLRLAAPAGAERRFVSLRREVDFDAGSIDAVTVLTHGLRRGRLRLFWAPRGTGFDPQRSLTLRARRHGSDELESYTFELARHPRWAGGIAALRLDLPAIAGQPIEVAAVRGAAVELDAEKLGGAVARPWQVELDHDLRQALLAPPGLDRDWRFETPPAGTLRFAYGLPAGAAEPVDFAVVWRRDDGTEAPLWRDRLEPASKRLGRWHDATVALGALGRGPGRLVFATRSALGYDLRAAVPAWANPEVVPPDPDPERINVILISADTLRADRLSVYGYPEPTTPRIDAWAKRRAAVFSRAVATAPWTLPSHVSMLTGLDALSHGVNHEQPASAALELLPERLRAAGYATLAVTGGGWLRPEYGFAQGFDAFRYWPHGTADSSELTDGVERALALIEAHAERPFFLFFHTYETHDPYRARQPYAERCPAGDGALDLLYGARPEKRRPADGFALSYRFVRWRPDESPRAAVAVPAAELPLVDCLYDSGVAYLDAQLGRLFDRLRELDLERRTLVVLTSDHGESLGEDGRVKHAYLVDSNLLVPLLVAFPDGTGAGRTVETQVSTIDLVPTVLDALGVPAPPGLDGGSLLPLVRGAGSSGTRVAWSYAGSANRGLALRVDGRLQYVFNNTAWPPVQGRERLVDLASGDAVDGGDAKRRLEPLRERLARHLEARRHGVELRFENRGCGVFEGWLEGRAIHVARVKAERLPEAALRWARDRRAGFRVAPGESWRVLLEAASGELELDATLAPCAGGAPRELATRIDLATLGADEVRRLVVADPAGGEAAIEVRAVGRTGAGVAAPEEVDPALVEQLRALGYVE